MHDEALAVLPRLLAALQIHDAILMGHSDGGSIALIYAGGVGCHGIRGIITEAAHLFCEELSIHAIAAIRTLYQQGDLRQKLLKYHGDNVDNVDNAFWGWNDVWLTPEFRHWNIEEYLAPITVPVLAIQGNEDQYGTRAQVEAIAAHNGGAVELLLLPDCGHTPIANKKQQHSPPCTNSFIDCM